MPGLGDTLTEEWIFRRAFCKLVTSQVGAPYVRGAQDPGIGFDCSGLVVWACRELGLLYPTQDLSSQGLHDLCAETCVPRPADLVFYGRAKDRVSHVVICLGGGYVIGASGGGQDCTTAEIARKRGAEIKVHDIGYRLHDRLGYGRLVNPTGADDWKPSPLLEVK